MNRKLLILFTGVIVVACSSTPQHTQNIPLEWAQKPEERGKLSVGQVIAIEPRREEIGNSNSKPNNGEIDYWGFSDDGYLSFGEFAVLPFIPIVLFTGDFVMLFTDEKTSGNPTEPSPEEKASPEEYRMVYRHVIRLTGTDENVVRDELFSYKTGDCVALRSKPDVLVPAVPDQCKIFPSEQMGSGHN